MTVPAQPEQPLRQRVEAALDAEAYRPRAERHGLVNVMLDLVQADLAARDAEIQQLRAQLADAEQRAERWEQARDAEVLATARVFDDYYRRWQSTIVEARRQSHRADELERQAVNSAWNTMRLGEEITRLRAALREARDTLNASVPIAEAAQDAATVLDAVLALHRPVARGAMTICDACSPLRGDGPSRYVLVPHPCPTADALTKQAAWLDDHRDHQALTVAHQILGDQP
ncbi:hypothetical protein [Kitasatospora griseola]|uniref:hypothetical protein n=1 Tax=Kitasatospora griseola TaxID=2064 RepID=UPI00382BEDF3